MVCALLSRAPLLGLCRWKLLRILNAQGIQGPGWETGRQAGRVQEGTELMSVYLQSQGCETSLTDSHVVLPNVYMYVEVLAPRQLRG